jgi:hypothetical protein
MQTTSAARCTTKAAFWAAVQCRVVKYQRCSRPPTTNIKKKKKSGKVKNMVKRRRNAKKKNTGPWQYKELCKRRQPGSTSNLKTSSIHWCKSIGQARQQALS